MFYIIEPLLNVYLLSSLTILLGYVLDFTISKKTLINYCKNNLDLYIEGIQSTFTNLLIISPINYLIVYNSANFLISFSKSFDLIRVIFILLIHNILYFILHYLVHNVTFIRFIHEFHHKFKINLPSIGNAVSIYEFQLMYVVPFLVASYLLIPSVLEFNAAIMIISSLNCFIHCSELKNSYWIKFLVSPRQHCNHHLTYYGTYSAPLINFDLIFNKFKKN